MDRVPIKLISNTNVRNHLLKLKNETSHIDTQDYIESRIHIKRSARDLMAIEDASEIAKQFLQERGIFEKIGEDIKKESGVHFKFVCTTTPRKTHTGLEYRHIAHTYPDGGGHYGLVRVDHTAKTIKLFNSMGPNRREFIDELETSYSLKRDTTTFQPTGGFVTTDVKSYKQLLKDTKIRVPNTEILEKSFKISQYDELSQHHFCYIEAFIAMMHDTMGTPLGPKDPRDRLSFVKAIVWGLIHKYVPKAQRNTLEWTYFTTNFPYYMKVTDAQGQRFRLNHIAQIPKSGEKIRKILVKMELPGNIDAHWSLQRIVNWAGSKI